MRQAATGGPAFQMKKSGTKPVLLSFAGEPDLDAAVADLVALMKGTA